MRAPVLVGILTLPVLLAACALPESDDPFGGDLETGFEGIPGLTPEHTRSHPSALHVHGDHAFVALPGTIARPDDRIAVIDLERGTLDGHIRVGARPVAFAADPTDPERLFVASPYSDTIAVIDLDEQALVDLLPAPYYIEDLAFTPSGDRLLAVDRDQDRIIVFSVDRDDERPTIEETRSLPTGPNPQHLTFVPAPGNTTWTDGRLVAATDRHGASVTIADLETGHTRRLSTGGAPLALAADAGLLFVAGYGPGNGTGIADPNDANRTRDAGTADIENSLLVLDLRLGPALFQTHENGTYVRAVEAMRYISDTAHPAKAHERLRILAGASPHALHLDDGTLWIAYHGTDQVQRLVLTRANGAGLDAGILSTASNASGGRLSNLAQNEPLNPGRLGDSTHGVYETRPGPVAVQPYGNGLLVVAEFPEELQALALDDCPGSEAPTVRCTSVTIPVVDDPVPWPTGRYEEGERLFYSALPSADQDRSCASCHVGGLSTGGTWALPHRDGVPVRIPRLDQVADDAPWLYDGSVRLPADYMRAAGGDLLKADASDPSNLAARARLTPTEADRPGSEGLTARLQGLANATSAEDFLDLTFAYALGEERLLPIPPRLQGEADGARLFGNDRTECMSCHQDGTSAHLVTGPAAADIPKPPNATAIKAPPLNGLWDRQGIGFLYDARAATLSEALLPTGHPCLPAGATGQQDDWHGNLDDRTCGAVEDLTMWLLAYQARR